MKVTIAKWGNSKAVRLPKALTDAQGLQEGTKLDLIVDKDGFHFRRSAKSSRELLAEMVAEMDRLGPNNRPEVINWGPDVGSEIIDDDYSRGRIPTPVRGPRVGRPDAGARARAGRRQASRGTHRP
jgi:antitoxin MazE